MSEFKKGAASLLRSRGLYIALALCLVAAGTVGYLTTLQRPAVQTVVPEEVDFHSRSTLALVELADQKYLLEVLKPR